jgi:conjugal transfer pilus assembly protein TraF
MRDSVAFQGMKDSVAVFEPYCFAEKVCGVKAIRPSCFTLLIILCTCFSSLRAEPNSFVSSHQKPQESAKVALENSPKIGSSFKLASKNEMKDYPTAQPSFFERRAEGWHWYEDREREDEEKPLKQKRPNASHSQTPTEKIEAQRKDLETKLHTAILEPSRENIITYILVQKALMDQSQRFSESWKRVVMTTPALDETLAHPVDQNARHVYYQTRNQEITKRIKALAQEYGLFFFFKGNCPYCHHFAPIVKHFAKKHGWSVLPISLDGGVIPEFPNAKRDNGMAARLQVSHVPALIAFHSGSGQMIPLAYGMVSESEIEERIDVLTRTFNSEGLRK